MFGKVSPRRAADGFRKTRCRPVASSKSTYQCALLAVALGFIACMAVLAVTGKKQADAVSESVLRFHIVADSDSERDQALKLKVRDGIAALTERLFADAQSKERVMEIAAQNRTEIAGEAERILRENGSSDSVEVDIANLYFPTKSYENITFPAGRYDAINVRIGQAAGQNFWCVMYPALCVPSAAGAEEEVLSAVLTDREVDFVTRPYTLKFKLVEWWNKLCHLFE